MAQIQNEYVYVQMRFLMPNELLQIYKTCVFRALGVSEFPRRNSELFISVI